MSSIWRELCKCYWQPLCLLHLLLKQETKNWVYNLHYIAFLTKSIADYVIRVQLSDNVTLKNSLCIEITGVCQLFWDSLKTQLKDVKFLSDET